MRLEPEFWQALDEISERKGMPMNAIMREIDATRGNFGRTGACRVYILNYFRSAMPESGHADAGHGQSRNSVAAFNLRPVEELFSLSNTRSIGQLRVRMEEFPERRERDLIPRTNIRGL
jgi:predicted DNA-binding ribbon-helix-helix protein